MSDDKLRDMVASTQRNVSQFLNVLQTKVLAIETEIEDILQKLDEVRGAKEMLTELLRHAGLNPPTLVFHSGSETTDTPVTDTPDIPMGIPTTQIQTFPVIPIQPTTTSQPTQPQPTQPTQPQPPPTAEVREPKQTPRYPLSYSQPVEDTPTEQNHQNALQPTQSPDLPSNYYPRIREVIPSRGLETVVEDKDGEAMSEQEQRIRERVLGRRTRTEISKYVFQSTAKNLASLAK